MWLLAKLEKRLKVWSNKWLSRAGRLVLIKTVLEAIPVYWMSLSWIPKGILEKERRMSFSYLWRGKSEKPSVALGTLGENCETQGLGWLGIKKHFSLLKSPGGQISLATNFDNKSVDQSDPTKVCGPTLYPRMDQEPWIQNIRDLSNVEGGSTGL
jgi:hypothetical protein